MARKILLADDSVTAQNMGRRILTDAGYEVVTVNNGSAALKRIAESKPDLIVLDVYMPGYGGLEVCQRIRDSQETARIPVLLTVGKLEPFKPEEVRRVRADAFIVKPFEASELLTALTKLEDKIVPQPAPYKPGRFAKAIAAFEGSGAPANEYGDLEKGWKNRLKIPPPDRKSHDDEPEEIPVSRSEPQKPHGTPTSPETSAAPTAAMLRGVTAEEIAAIEAAAAALSGHATGSIAEPESTPETSDELEKDQASPEATPASTSDSSVEGVAPMTFAAAPVAESQGELSPPEVESQSSTAAETAAGEQAETLQAAPAEADVAATESAVDAASSTVSEASTSPREEPAEDDVAAALASLAPTNGHGIAAVTTGECKGPRWIAEAVSLTEDESSVTLEDEMQRALAAFAAADAARESMAFPAAEAVAVAASESAQVEQTASIAQAEEFLGIPSTTDAVAEPVAAPAEAAVSEVPEEAAYAAAAAASAGSVEPNFVSEMPLSHVGLP